ncbi:MAG TPA: hypothetical protein VM369_07280 [Candidatus Binatia bacterium]|nr:hypothetical protein [Candidatus Binatia bacterium]
MRIVLALSGLLVSAAATAAEPASQLHIHFGLDFGLARAPAASYGFALRSADVPAATPPLLAIDASGREWRGALLGVPVASRYQLNDAESEGAPVARAPWYARRWVWWTAGGLAATATVLSLGSDNNETHQCTGTCNQDNTGNGLTIDGQNENGVGCVGPACVLCNDGDIASGCNSLTSRQPRVWLAPAQPRPELGPFGDMGDLVAR